MSPSRRHGPGTGPAAWLLAGLLCACQAPAWAALSLQAASSGLAPAERVATDVLLAEAAAKLPPRLRESLDRTVTVRWADTLAHDTWGRARREDLLLNRRLLAALVDGSAARLPGGRAHRSQRDELLATVVHELAHFHDRHARLSSDPRLLDLAGWQIGVTRLGGRRDNRFVDRSPDPYERTSPGEFVAVNLEYFLLDPEFRCRRPALHRYFAAHFDWSPPETVACDPGLAFLDAGNEADDADGIVRLDPERVYGVDYLFAEGNDQVMSRWGHSMLRLVVCAPGRPRGPDCRLDLQHHRVLSFRAFVDDVQLSSWRGLTGAYPSRMFVLPLEQVVQEYTKVELRGLQSISLRLERGEIAGLLERAAQLHWGYDGQYYFLSNNCAVETFRLLHDGVPRLAHERLGSITPTGLLSKLRRRGLADASVLDDRAEARRLGYRFDSMAERFEAMYAAAHAALPLPATSASEWLALPAGSRRPFLARADLRASAALLLLEEAALQRQQLLARDELKRRFFFSMAGSPRAAPVPEYRPTPRMTRNPLTTAHNPVPIWPTRAIGCRRCLPRAASSADRRKC